MRPHLRSYLHQSSSEHSFPTNLKFETWSYGVKTRSQGQILEKPFRHTKVTFSSKHSMPPNKGQVRVGHNGVKSKVNRYIFRKTL